MKFRFTDIALDQDGGQFIGRTASFEVTESDGSGLIARDSYAFVPSEGSEPTYASLSAVSALTQTQIYNDFRPSEVLDSSGTTAGDLIEQSLQEDIDAQVSAAQQAATPTISFVDEITDQTPISV